jgi:hypothetical protein
MADGRQTEATNQEGGGLTMRRRIQTPADTGAPYQALVDHKAATLNVILSQIPEISTFAQLGGLIGYSHEWIRQRLVQNPERLYKNGRRYKVPKGVAEEFIRSVFV